MKYIEAKIERADKLVKILVVLPISKAFIETIIESNINNAVPDKVLAFFIISH